MESERRSFKRLPAEAEVRILPVDPDAKDQARSLNLSGGGILIESERPYEPGAVLDIEVIGPVHRSFSRVFPPLKARLRVLRVSGDGPYELAGEFLEVS
ncbi:MAG: PilZ domain-containing protein [Deltaproteobacteria bacterium]|nr:PilZ domain-containing protein [Deltaproteobacteria bacterium]